MAALGADVVVVGGGPAGLSTALFLAAAAPELTDRVVVLERGRYPREKYCAGAIGARADKVLASIGVRVEVPSVTLDVLGVRIRGSDVLRRRPGLGRVVRRLEFDHELARVARGRGIRIEEGRIVDAIELGPDGVTVRAGDLEVHADVVVGADGVGSVVRKHFGLGPGRDRAQVVEVDTPPVDADLAPDTILFDLSDRALPGYAWDFPTPIAGGVAMCRGVYVVHTHEAARSVDVSELLRARLVRQGIDPSGLRFKRYAERGFSPTEAIARPRALLVGEAAGIDPVTGEGIAQAITSGEVAGRYLGARVRDRAFAFDDYREVLAATPVGKDLRWRTRMLAAAYGRTRPLFERVMQDGPASLDGPIAWFAGDPIPWGPASSGVARGLLSATRAWLSTPGFASTRTP